MKLEKNIYKRLDISVKLLFIHAYKIQKKYSYFSQLYLKHIKYRVAFYEWEKSSKEDFLDSFIKLIESIESNGFNNSYKIEVDSEWNILSWAHRLACCIYFWITPPYKKIPNKTPNTWNHAWFCDNNFTLEERVHILNTHKQYFWWILTVVYHKSDDLKQMTLKALHESFSITAVEELSFPNMLPIIDEIYSYNDLDPRLLAQEKWSILNNNHKSMSIVLISEESPEAIADFKNKLREDVAQKNKYFLLHSPESVEENEYLCNIFLHFNTLKHQQLRSNNDYSNALIRRILKLKTHLDTHWINDFCIVWWACLDIFGLYESDDIDIVISEEQRKNLQVPETSHKLNKSTDIVSQGYSSKFSDKSIISDAEKYFRWKGFKCIWLELLREKKYESTREKDRRQLQIIDDILVWRNHHNTKNKFGLKRKIYYSKLLLSAKFINLLIRISKTLGVYPIVSKLWRTYYLKK